MTVHGEMFACGHAVHKGVKLRTVSDKSTQRFSLRENIESVEEGCALRGQYVACQPARSNAEEHACANRKKEEENM